MVVLLGLASFHHRGDRPDRLTLLASMAALMLATMAVPLGPLGHLNLAAVVGILLGPSSGFIAAAIVNAILALLGHGGLSTVGLNSLILGVGTAVAKPVYVSFRRWASPGKSGAAAALASVTVSVVALFAVVAIALSSGAPTSAIEGHGHEQHGHGLGLEGFVLLSIPFWVMGAAAEALVTASLISFLARVEPGLLPAEGRA